MNVQQEQLCRQPTSSNRPPLLGSSTTVLQEHARSNKPTATAPKHSSTTRLPVWEVAVLPLPGQLVALNVHNRLRLGHIQVDDVAR